MCLARQAVHQVEVERIEMLTGQLRGTFCLVRTVNAAECFQVVVVETLDAERQPIDAGGAKAGELFGFDGAGIGFQRDLGLRRQHGKCAEGGDQFVDGSGREQAGRAATEKNRLHRPPPDQR